MWSCFFLDLDKIFVSHLFISFVQVSLVASCCCALVSLSLLSSREAAEGAKGAGWVAGGEKALSPFCLHPASPGPEHIVICSRIQYHPLPEGPGGLLDLAERLHGQLLGQSSVSQGQNKIKEDRIKCPFNFKQ